MLRQSSRLANFSKSIIKNLPLNPKQVKRYVADKCCPPDPKQAPNDSQFKSDAFNPPGFLPVTVYRPLSANEVLGPGAHKCKEYKNPEYFAYNRFSFFALQEAALELSKCAEGGLLYDAESESEGEDEDICDYEGYVEPKKEEKGEAKFAKECKEGEDKGAEQNNDNSIEGEKNMRKDDDKCED